MRKNIGIFKWLKQFERFKDMSSDKLSNLQSLSLRNTHITELPSSIGELSNLQSLSLRNTHITELPSSIGELSNLQSLDLGNTQIKELPSFIGELSNLQSLDLGGTQITELPSFIGELSNLQLLYLSGTQITELPLSIGELSNLQLLNLFGTQITKLPSSIGKLSNLQSLHLSYTQIKELPSSIGKLSKLQSLSLAGTLITELPNCIGELLNLQTLSFSDTQITELPSFIGRLSNLEILYLYDTQITDLPSFFGELSQLKKLDLCNCHLKAIPYSVVQLGLRVGFVTDNDIADENCVNLTGVTLDEGDITIFSQSPDVIEAYYRDRVLDLANECKVIFLGDGAAGKSSLIERIAHPEKPFVEGSLPTDGIKMTKWRTALGDKPLNLSFLDFGGQEIMHAMHRCFLTAHTVYVVVCESRDDAEIDSVAARWMETVKAFAPDCPVILALNKSDLNPNVTVNERTLKDINKNYRVMIHTSAKTDDDPGLKQLIAYILREVPGCLSKLNGNAGFLALKRELEDMEEDYIFPEDFDKRCDGQKIQKELREDLLNWFQDLGVAYSYSAIVQKIYVLNPRWLTNGIYRLILRTPNGGFLSRKTIEQTLETKNPRDIDPDKIYTGQEIEFILYIMRRFQISMEIRDDNGENKNNIEMIPMKMDKTPPAIIDDFPKGDALHLRWAGAYLPNNLIHRLLIRKFPELNRDCVWRTGGWFRQNGGNGQSDGGGDCQALAEMNDKALDVYVTGPRDRRRIYMESFRAEIGEILRSLNIRPEEIICHTVNGKEGYAFYDTVWYSYTHGNDPIFITEERAFTL